MIYCYFISFIGSPFARLCGVSDKLGNLLKYVRECTGTFTASTHMFCDLILPFLTIPMFCFVLFFLIEK